MSASWTREAMDAPDVDPDQLADSLDKLAHLSAATGARRAVANAALRLMPRGARVSVLDVGTGGADVLRYLRRRLGGRLALGIGVDSHAETARCADRRCSGLHGLHVLRADALALPLSADSVDLAMMNMALHHLQPGDRPGALAELARVAGGRVVVSDLARNALNRVGARLLCATIWRWNPVVKADAPVSVERGFRREELLELARAAGLRRVRVASLFGHRLILEAGQARA